MMHAFSSCDESHDSSSIDAISIYEVKQEVRLAISSMEQSHKQAELNTELEKVMNIHSLYISYLLRTKHQGEYFKHVVDNLKSGEAIIIVDYKMKLELGVRTREIQRDWYGKRGISLHGFLMIGQTEDKKRTEVIDLWSEDTKQDAWFSQCAMDIGLRWMEKELPGFHIHLFSDNGPHYHNTAFLMYLSEVNSNFNLTLVDYNNFEAGEGKSALDTHFALISHKIVRWVRVGNNLESGNQLGDLIGSMKNVTCRKLVIDRSKAPGKVGTLKNISLFGSFQFPTIGLYKGGLIASSLAGLGKSIEKTKSQLQSLSGRTSAVAGATGATVSDEIPICSTTAGERRTPTNYAVNFVQHPPEYASPISSKPAELHILQLLPQSGYALKVGGAKRTRFSQEQKDLMIDYYNRQANYGITADPGEAARDMEERGLERLEEDQIRRWWSTYHQKRKRELERMASEIHQLHGQLSSGSSSVSQVPTPLTPSGTTSSSSSRTISDTHTPTTHTVPVSSASSSVGSTTQTVTEPSSSSDGHSTTHTVPVSSVSSSVGSTTQTVTASTISSYPMHVVNRLLGTDVGNGIIEWYFPRNMCQSLFAGRNGSNACCLIAMYFGFLAHRNTLIAPCSGSSLGIDWHRTLEEAIILGNDLHDELFEGDPVNLSVNEAVDVAGEQCHIQDIVTEYNVFGANPLDQFKTIIDTIAKANNTFHVVVLNNMAMLLFVDAKGTLVFVDSHQHGRKGTLIAACTSQKQNQGIYFSRWFNKMLIDTWKLGLSIGSVTTISYELN